MRKFTWPGPGVLLAVAAAALFGASTPLAKMLISTTSPWMLAGLLYLGAGIGLALTSAIRSAIGALSDEAPLRKADAPWLAVIIGLGGIAGPVLLMFGLVSSSAAGASLLLNLEGIATMAIAWLVFKENVDRRLLLGAVFIVAGAIVISWHGAARLFDPSSLYIAAACLAWGIDNNLTRKLSSADPQRIALYKGIVAGCVNLALAFSQGAVLPPFSSLAAAGFVGFFGYGLSLVCFMLALRHLGAARTGAYFSTAPFIGAIVALSVLHEPLTWALVLAGLLMGLGVWLHLTERHEHEHTHDEMEHEHAHIHDDHHRHEHHADDPEGEPHSHPHRHDALRHKHPHYPDIHHRHSHNV